MSKAIKNWEELREYPSSEKSEISYIHHRHIERISIIEDNNGGFSILIHALNNTYFHTKHETNSEALSALTSVIERITE